MERDKESQNLVFMGTLCNERIKCGNIATMIIHENARKWIKIMKIHQIRNSRRFREIFRISNVIRKPLLSEILHNFNFLDLYNRFHYQSGHFYSKIGSKKTGTELYETIKMCVFDKKNRMISCKPRCSSALLLRNQNTYFLSPLYINTL